MDPPSQATFLFATGVFLACVTEQTHDFRVYRLPNGARFAVS